MLSSLPGVLGEVVAVVVVEVDFGVVVVVAVVVVLVGQKPHCLGQ